MVNVKNLVKIYKLSKKETASKKLLSNTKIAVNDISFHVNRGEIFGLLGPNGAGKTTTLRCMTTLLNPTSGSITIDHQDTVTHSIAVRNKICFLTNELKLDGFFTPMYTMQYFGKLHNMSNEDIINRTDILFSRFEIEKFKDKKISELSTGMKQKLSIAVSLIHDPQIIIFDEPTNGLDVITARTVTDFLEEMKAEGKTVIISTHIMSVAEKLCDRIAIILDGQLSCIGKIDDIVNDYHADNLEDAFFNLYKSHVMEGKNHA
jgi:sodium transport system ATP-binding protein